VKVVVGASVACTAFAQLPDPPVPCQPTNDGVTWGPDVIVGDITGPANYSSAGGIEALSLGTTSCNVGDVWLNWIASTNQHPVIGGTLYKYKFENGYGRFEQIGQSWLKHGFFALSEGLCCSGCIATDGSHLGVHCSDPYTAGRNGGQSNLGPKWQVNASTGVFTYPPANPSWSGTTARRLQVAITDLETSNGSTIRYFGEAQYVTPDDAAAGRKNNNASFREINVSGSGAAWTFNFGGTFGTTQRQKSAIRAWKMLDPAVSEVGVNVSGDGLYILAWKVTDLGNSTWHYEYALYNMNGHRSGQAFSVPMDDSLPANNVGFHDVEYRNGDGINSVNYSNVDWTSTKANGVLRWETQTFAQNQNANALRWGTTYNFRFDSNVPPMDGNVTMTFFRPGGAGDPTEIAFPAQVPSEPQITPPQITQQPASAESCTGDSVSFTVVASGDSLSYQWRKDGADIGGANAATYTINPVTTGSAGSYDVVVTNPAGSVTSDAATLTVNVRGDANCDGVVNNFDIDPFVLAISSGQAAWEAAYSCDFLCACDADGDGVVNNFDIDPFVALLNP
jgi:hypothetical protein